MAKIFYERDANLDLLKGKTVGIIGFGSQGHAHAQNLRDGGCDVVVGALPSSRSWKAAKKARFDVGTAADAARKAGRSVASKNLGFTTAPEPAPKVRWGIPETVLTGLFLLGIIGRLRRFKHTKKARWISMLIGLFVLGFLLNKPFTLVLVNKLLLGFWPQWQLHLYSYILVAGILLITLADNKNPYCEWFCPFGSAQECLAVIGGGKKRPPKNVHNSLRWFQRMIALGAIVIALFFRNPSITSYEVFGAFFHLIGTNFHFILLGIVLVAALFIRRPWCSYLCPLRPVTDYIRLVRNWIRDIRIGLRPKGTQE